ncbi:MAG: hypothetical protein PHG16_09395 [Lachnospiraceae bacterium]|nr:hypothetical protein [Lachnospiraceae bacterium]
MNCMNCGAVVKDAKICPNCGFDLAVQKLSFQLSNRYYNQGLDKAQIRDLSGAIDMLRRSLKFNKLNIPARNLLGLVYFETGEAVAALSEWIISKNIMPENNLASIYIQKLQSEPAKLDMINQTIKKFNTALKCCREDNEDVAAIQLKKILTQNPKLIKGYHLQALIYLKRAQYEKARKILKKAARIDKTNSTTLRFLKEIDEQTGTVTKLEPRKFFGSRNTMDDEDTILESERTIQPMTFRESSVIATMLNICIGLVIGGLAVGFLIVPSMRQNVSRSADMKVAEYSNTMASQQTQIAQQQAQIEESNNTVASAQQQVQDATSKTEAYENLMKASAAYASGDQATAANLIQGINTEILSVDAKAVYNNMYQSVQSTMFTQLSTTGVEAFDDENWSSAIDNLKKAKAINANDYTVLNYLAHAYRCSGDSTSAIAEFQEIIDKFPNTKRAESAANFITQLGGTAAPAKTAATPTPGTTVTATNPPGDDGTETPKDEDTQDTAGANPDEDDASEQ